MNKKVEIKVGTLITAKILERGGPCPHQLTRFKNVFPNGLKLTTRNLNMARTKYRLNTMWFLGKFLRPYYSASFAVTGINSWKAQFTKKDGRAIHQAVIKLLKEDTQ